MIVTPTASFVIARSTKKPAAVASISTPFAPRFNANTQKMDRCRSGASCENVDHRDYINRQTDRPARGGWVLFNNESEHAMPDSDTPERFEKLSHDVDEAIKRDATSNAQALAQRYGLEPEYVEAMLPRTYMRIAIGIELQRAGCTDEVISECIHHVWMLVNGVKSYSGK